MLGRWKSLFNAKSPAPPSSSDSWAPYRKMDAALTASICLLSQALEQAGEDCGGLSIKDRAPAAVGPLLADSVIYAGDKGPEFLALALTHDFKAFSYQPHCRLFLIINAVLILEDLKDDSPFRREVAISQVPGPLVDACLMKRWIKYIGPIGQSLAEGRTDKLRELHQGFANECVSLRHSVPEWIFQRVNFDERAQEWCSGFAATLGHPLTSDVKRINSLPMTGFIADLITKFLIETQVQGLRETRQMGG